MNTALKSRRHFIKQLSLGSGGVLLAPLKHQLAAEAAGTSSAFPQRFVFLIKSSGLTPDAITPTSLRGKTATGTSPLTAALKNHALPESLQPLEPFKNQLGIVQGFSGKMCLAGHTAYFGAMGVHPSPSETSSGLPLRATIDTRLSSRSPSPFGHVGLALRGRAVGGAGDPIPQGTIYPGLSALAPGRELPFQASPDQAYDQLFGSAMGSAQGQKRYGLESGMLDFLSSDIRRLRKQVPSAEQSKLDHYLVAFEELQQRRKKLASMGDIIRHGAPELTDKFASENGMDRLESHFALAASCLITGLSNGVTIRMDNLEHVYSGLGLSEQNVHAIGHGTGSNGKSADQCRDLIRTYHIKLIAALATKLQAVPEGDGTMLDNTIIVYLSDAGESHHGSLHEWPFLTVGGAGGRLKIPGQYLRMPGYGQPGHATIGNLYTSLLNAYGDPVDHFGDLDFELERQDLPQRGAVASLIA
ncbi:MAG: DUF1552 domain-containing protein [Verrucomicrobiales bacterium]|nr:DUF1552 domain-containing protein [Verrucomicrobiales bacterium]